MTRYQMRTFIPSGIGLVENIPAFGLSQDYRDSSNEISKRLNHLFGLHFVSLSGGLKSRLQGQQ